MKNLMIAAMMSAALAMCSPVAAKSDVRRVLIGFICETEGQAIERANRMADETPREVEGCRSISHSLPGSIAIVLQETQRYARNGKMIVIGEIELEDLGEKGWSAGLMPMGQLV